MLANRRATIRRGIQLVGGTFARDRNTPKGRLRGFGHWRAARLLARPVVSGPVSRVRVSQTAGLDNVLINTVCGYVEIGDHVFFGHDVMLLTGTHDFATTGLLRKRPRQTLDRSIIIAEGAWIASRSIIIGPCRIGANAVIGCGCVIDFDVPANTVVRVRQELVMEPIRYSDFARSGQRSERDA